MKQVEIKELDLLGEQEGNATYSTEINSFSKGRILAYRAKDSVSGNHWHGYRLKVCKDNVSSS